MITKFYEIYEINTKVHTIHDYYLPGVTEIYDTF